MASAISGFRTEIHQFTSVLVNLKCVITYKEKQFKSCHLNLCKCPLLFAVNIHLTLYATCSCKNHSVLHVHLNSLCVQLEVTHLNTLELHEGILVNEMFV